MRQILIKALLPNNTIQQRSRYNAKVFTDKYQRQNYLRIKEILPERATVGDLIQSGEYTEDQIIRDIAHGKGPVFTCEGEEASYLAAMAYGPGTFEYMLDAEEEQINPAIELSIMSPDNHPEALTQDKLCLPQV